MQFYGDKVIENCHYLVSERINGPDLEDFFFNIKDMKIVNNDILNDWWKFELKFLYQCGKSLSSLEKARLIHRDLKPDNFMIHIEDANFKYEKNMVDDPEFLKKVIRNQISFSIKLIDLGLARTISSDASWKSKLSKTGNADYTAPEIKKEDEYD